MTDINKSSSIKLFYRSQRALADAYLLYKEKSYESVVNRSYYAMLYASKAVFALDGKSCGSHNAAINMFSKYCIDNVFENEYGRNFNRVGDVRNKVDYDDDYDLLIDEVNSVISTADSFCEKIEHYLLDKGCKLDYNPYV